MAHWNDLPVEIKSRITAEYTKLLISEYRLPPGALPDKCGRLISSMKVELASFQRAYPEMRDEAVRSTRIMSRSLRAEEDTMRISTEQDRWALRIVEGKSDIVYHMLDYLTRGD